MTEIVISSERELAEVIAEKFEDGVMLSIFIEEGSEMQAGEIMGVKMIDHIIVGCGTEDHISFAASGMLTENFDLNVAVREPKIMEDLKKDWHDLTGKEQDLKSQIKKLKRREALER